MAGYFEKLNAKIEKEGIKHLGDGLNTFQSPFYIKSSEASSNKNTFVDNYPELRTRYGFGNFAGAVASGTVSGIYNRGFSELHVNDGGTWKYWNTSTLLWVTIVGSLGTGRCSFVDFKTTAKNYTYFTNGVLAKLWDGATVTSVSNMPLTYKIAVDDFRIYAGLDSTLYWTNQGDPSDWVGGDSGNVLLSGIRSNITALTKFGQDQIVVFSEASMHVLYGSDSADFYQLDPICAGCISQNSVCESNGILYFLDRNKLKYYSGGNPEILPGSEKIQYYLDNMLLQGTYYRQFTHCMIAYGDFIYISIPMSSVSVNNKTLVFNKALGQWHVWDFGFKAFTVTQVTLESISYLTVVGVGASDNRIYVLNNIPSKADKLAGGETSFSWEHITPCINSGILSCKKVLSAIYVHFLFTEYLEGDYFKLAYSENISGAFTDLYTFTTSSSDQVVKVNIPTSALNDSNYFRLKFYGVGQCKIIGYETEYRVKS